MQVNITVPPGEHAADLAGNSEELADAFLTAAGMNKDKDFCSVSIADSGQVGTTPEPPPL